ncbi:MAG: alpha/beta fold hydrolase [Pseudomonadota bacterium]
MKRQRLAAAITAVVCFAAALLDPIGAAAETCGATDAPCVITVAGESGVYNVETPPRSDDAPIPALVFLHGWGGSGEGQMRSRALVESVTARGYAFIAPTGQPRGEGRNGARWNAFGTQALRDDVAFLRAVAQDAAERFNLDRDRILLGGFSGGGMMTWRVACDAPDDFAAYAPVAGLLWRPLPDACAGPIRLLHTHGWSDPVVPIEGRSVAGGRITQGDLFEGLDLLRRANGCVKDDPDAYAEDGPFWRRVWTACAPGSALEMALHKGGHTTPRGWSAMALDWFEGQLGATTAERVGGRD